MEDHRDFGKGQGRERYIISYMKTSCPLISRATTYPLPSCVKYFESLFSLCKALNFPRLYSLLVLSRCSGSCNYLPHRPEHISINCTRFIPEFILTKWAKPLERAPRPQARCGAVGKAGSVICIKKLQPTHSCVQGLRLGEEHSLMCRLHNRTQDRRRCWTWMGAKAAIALPHLDIRL